MSDRRVVVEERLCPHGHASRHIIEGSRGLPRFLSLVECPGGSRRVLELGSYVLIEKDDDGEWPTPFVPDMLDRLAGDTP